MPRRSLIRRIARFPAWKLRLLPEAIFWLLMARAALLLVPFPRIGRYLGKLQSPSPQPPRLDEATALWASRIGKTVDTAADWSPLPLVCLPRALAGWQMLHRRGIPSRLHFGAPREQDRMKGLQTHAWLSSSGVEVTGYPVAHDCVELGYFSRVEKRLSYAGGQPVASNRP